MENIQVEFSFIELTMLKAAAEKAIEILDDANQDHKNLDSALDKINVAFETTTFENDLD